MKTAKEVQDDIYKIVKNSSLASSISGTVYKDGFRPRDSKKEDAVVVFITGTADQIQKGYVNVNVFVPDIVQKGNGVYLENGKRTAEIEAVAKSLVQGLRGLEYRFRLDKMISTFEEEDTHQHYINIPLYFEIL